MPQGVFECQCPNCKTIREARAPKPEISWHGFPAENIIKTLMNGGYDRYIWHTQPLETSCKDCQAMDGHDGNLSKLVSRKWCDSKCSCQIEAYSNIYPAYSRRTFQLKWAVIKR